MSVYVARTCTEIPERGVRDGSHSVSRALESFRDADAFVLLGAPGAGKTTAFRREAEDTGGCYVTARDFVTYDDRPEWREGTLYIDGLDETRPGSADGPRSLDNVRAKLYRLGRPRFRLSCRSADFGANDRDHLDGVWRDRKITVLRLDPLSDTDIHRIMDSCGVDNADGFIAKAGERGILDLLANPQSLRMLAAAVADNGDWPDTRMQTFDMACRKLLPEHKRKHREAEIDVDIPRLMNAAGRLCALQLLTGSVGFTLNADDSDPDFLDLARVPGDDRHIFRLALRTKLFDPSSEDRVTPVHRQVAEFLAARYVAELVDQGLPVGRVLALMTGNDGAVVPQLRGLSAWLAAHSKTGRPEIIERDPLGTILYGDVRDFSADEKSLVLSGLEREATRNPWFTGPLQIDSRLSDLAAPDMEDVFRQSLTGPAGDDARQSFVSILLESLRYKPVLPGLADLLTNIVRDARWPPYVTLAALDALITQLGTAEYATARLEGLLKDVHDGSVSDPEDDLLGTLLTELYPDRLPASEVWNYLRTPHDRSLCGRYTRFWTTWIGERSTPARVAEVLDGLADRFERLRPVFRGFPGEIAFLRPVPIKLLQRLLEESSEDIPSDRLFDWLGIAADPELRASAEDAEFLGTWLSRNPGMQKRILETGVARCADSPDFSRCVFDVEARLFDAERPADFGQWCLDQAMEAAGRTGLDAAEYFVGEVADCVYGRRFDHGLSRGTVEQRLRDHAVLLRVFTERLAVREATDARVRGSRERYEIERQRHRLEWRDDLRRRLAALRENRCEPAVLHQLAQAYFGLFADIDGDTPRDRMRDLFGNDEPLIEAVLQGLRGSVRRSDVPDDVEIMRLATENQTHSLALPFLAGLEEIAADAPEGRLPLDEKQRRQAFAFAYSELPDPALRWYARESATYPDVAADVLVRSVRAEMRSGKSHLSGVYRLEDNVAVARRAALPVLESFPARCATPQMRALVYLIETALRHCDEAAVLELIERKLDRRSMNVAQRVCWLAVGLVLSPGSYQSRLEEYVVGQDERRVRHLAHVMCRGHFPSRLSGRLEAPALSLLIRVLGRSHEPGPLGAPAGCVKGFIDQLASMASTEATEAIESLASDDALEPWRAEIIDAGDRQNAIRREAGFRHFSVEQVIKTLEKQAPANAADLAALTCDCLREIARTVRRGNASGWLKYWNVDSYNRPEKPKPENACRGYLVEDLRLRTKPLHIDVQPEAAYAGDTRSDIRVAHGGFNVPVEIKRSCHRDLWSAVRTQLIDGYARGLGADGHGIYLVFWFGDAATCRPTRGSGPPPKSAAELEEHLRGTLSDEERLKASICVIDVSVPDA